VLRRGASLRLRRDLAAIAAGSRDSVVHVAQLTARKFWPVRSLSKWSNFVSRAHSMD